LAKTHQIINGIEMGGPYFILFFFIIVLVLDKLILKTKLDVFTYKRLFFIFYQKIKKYFSILKI